MLQACSRQVIPLASAVAISGYRDFYPTTPKDCCHSFAEGISRFYRVCLCCSANLSNRINWIYWINYGFSACNLALEPSPYKIKFRHLRFFREDFSE